MEVAFGLKLSTGAEFAREASSDASADDHAATCKAGYGPWCVVTHLCAGCLPCSCLSWWLFDCYRTLRMITPAIRMGTKPSRNLLLLARYDAAVFAMCMGMVMLCGW